MSDDLQSDPNVELELIVRNGKPPSINIDGIELDTNYRKWRSLKKDFRNAL